MSDLEAKKVIWTNSMSVGIPEIDKQHQKYFDIANHALSLLEGGSQSEIDAVLEELKNYARFHFKYEADLMKKYNYTESGYHYDAHGDFFEKVQSLSESDSENKQVEIVSFMQNWLVLHIKSTDVKMAKFILQHK